MPTTFNDLHDFISSNFQKFIIMDSLRNIIHNSKLFNIKIATPIEPERMSVSEEDIHEYFFDLYQNIHGIPASLVFNKHLFV